jgi:MFS family permease
MKQRDLRIYLAGLAVSLLGSSAMTVVTGIWVKTLTGSNSAAAWASVGLYLPSWMAPLAGVLADRVSRRRVLLVANLAAAAWLSLLWLVTSPGRAWLILVVAFGYGAVLVVIDPAEAALFTEIVPPERRPGVNGLRLSIQEGAKLLAPAAGAGVFALFGGRTVAAADAITFLAAALAVALLSPSPTRMPIPSPAPGRRLSGLTAGWDHIRRTPALLRLTIVAGLAMTISGTTAGAPYGLIEALHRSPQFLGVLTSLLGAGSILAGLVSARIIKPDHEIRLATLGLLAGTTGYSLDATGVLPAALAASVIFGLFLPWIVIAAITATQRLTPDHLQGRVSATLTLLLFAPLPVAQALGAATIGVLGYRLTYLLAAAGTTRIVVAISIRKTLSAETVAPGQHR